MDRVAPPSSQDDTEDLASMAVVTASDTEEVVTLQRNQTPSLDQVSGNVQDSSDESTSSSPRRPKTHSKARSKKERKVEKQAQAVAPPKHGPLRPAKDVLSRIRHDPTLDEEDFIIGYSDRHADVQELPVTLWKGDTTDDEFIPQHRILYFRRKGDGCKVWDRADRLDALFGSGQGAPLQDNVIKPENRTV
jgi:uncharacterized protein (UPF0248 family)